MVFCRILFCSGSEKIADYLVISKIHLNFAPIFSQKILKKSERHSHQQSLFLYDKGADAAQGNEKFSDKKSLNYLAVPNNFITLSLSLIGAPSLISLKHTLSYARETCCAIPLDKGLMKVSFVPFFVPFCIVRQGKIRTILTY